MAVEDRLYGRWRSFVWPLEIVCMALGYRLYGRWRSFLWRWRSFAWPFEFDRLNGR